MPVCTQQLDGLLGGGSILQPTNRSHTQMMSYIVLSPAGRLIVIDGGNEKGDADFLRSELLRLGGHVDAWFITHGHDDHFGALMRLLEEGLGGISVDSFYFSFPEPEWFRSIEGDVTYGRLLRFYAALALRGVSPEPLALDEVFDFGGLTVRVLNDPRLFGGYHTVNDSSVCLRFDFPACPVLFTGDLNVEAQADLLGGGNRGLLRCPVVQMAHHGQSGADRDFYAAVSPSVCLWPTPDWLWVNDRGGGPGSGPWTTLETRRWADELGVKYNMVGAFGDVRLS